MKIATHTVASFEYRLTDHSGELIDSSDGGEPMTYVHGTQSILPALEQELDGKEPGARFRLELAPADAYGERDEEMIETIERSELPPDMEVEVGMQLRAQSPEGARILTVVGVEDEHVHLDGNHPLAGVALRFDVTVVNVRPATRDEIQHGHVHGPGGHAH